MPVNALKFQLSGGRVSVVIVFMLYVLKPDGWFSFSIAASAAGRSALGWWVWWRSWERLWIVHRKYRVLGCGRRVVVDGRVVCLVAGLSRGVLLLCALCGEAPMPGCLVVGPVKTDPPCSGLAGPIGPRDYSFQYLGHFWNPS